MKTRLGLVALTVLIMTASFATAKSVIKTKQVLSPVYTIERIYKSMEGPQNTLDKVDPKAVAPNTAAIAVLAYILAERGCSQSRTRIDEPLMPSSAVSTSRRRNRT